MNPGGHKSINTTFLRVVAAAAAAADGCLDGKLSVKLPAAAAWILDTLGATPRLGGEVESTRAVNVPAQSFTLGLLFVANQKLKSKQLLKRDSILI